MVGRESILAAGLERKKSIYGNEWITPFNGKRMDTIRKAVLQREKNERRKPFNDKNWMGLELGTERITAVDIVLVLTHGPTTHIRSLLRYVKGGTRPLPCWLFEYLHSAIRV
jgi:hypothetical protein